MLQPTPLACPQCGQSLARCAGLLRCAHCLEEFRQSSDDWFFSLAPHAPTQERSLLIHEDKVSNPKLITFGVGLNTAELRSVLASREPSVVVDVGCAGGDYYPVFGPYSQTYIGIEPSPITRERRLGAPPPDNVVLVHNDPLARLPLVGSSADMVTFLASYDHIPNRLEVLAQSWDALKPGGALLICMTNYGFWAKRALNQAMGRQMARREDDHYCVHDPETLTAEVSAICPGATLCECRADFMYVPNTPLRFLYKSYAALSATNRILKMAVHGMLGQRRAGSGMICVFEKPAGTALSI
jgi:SAM-dependent methyltransferase